jgi:uncharacterized protein YceH (UPF0502 family)
VDADAVELRVLGCLIEKQRTTPEAYPLSLNALRLACNQSTNRDPVVAYDVPTIRAGLDRLTQRRWARLASGPGSRTAKYRHLFDDAVGLSTGESAILCVLMLRGPQTPGELNQRTQRLHPFASLDEIDGVLTGLIERELVSKLERRPGQKEQRYGHLLGEHTAAPSTGDGAVAPETGSEATDRITDVERELRELRDAVAALRAELASLREHRA